MELIEKSVRETVRIIEAFSSECYYEVESSHKNLNKAVAKTEKKEDGLHFEFSKMVLSSQDDRHRITYASSVPLKFSNNFSSLTFDLSDCNYKLSVGFSGHTTVSGYIKEFSTNALANYRNSYYRAVIIRNSDHALSGFFSHNSSLKIGNTTYGSGVLRITIKKIGLHIFSYTSKETKRTYFIIESQNIVSYSDFTSIQDEIILAITYLTGTFLGSEVYILGSTTNSYETLSVLGLKHFFDDLKNCYPAIPNVTFQHQLGIPPDRFKVPILENLIHELLNSLVYKRAVLLLCQAHTEPPYVTSTLYSVALETITNRISEKIKDKITPINDKELSSELKNELKKTLLFYKEKLSEEAYKKIEADIERINSLTNKQKLLAPFKYLNITLSQKEIEAIEKRNYFLHGRLPVENDRHHLPIINGRLLFAINCLILKHLEFSGYVMYTPGLYQFHNNLQIDEDLVRKI